jgi:1,4-dihydroxy-2-naphthoate octaprenyltransferase
MEKDEIKTNSLKAWVLAARPKTLTAAAVPVMIGTAMAWNQTDGDGFRYVAMVLCFLFAFVMQIDANFVNDYFDFKRGNDDETRLGPERACAQGWVTDTAMKKALVITTLLACLVGLPLIIYGGLEMIAVGAACVAFCFLYTTTLSYIAMGDVLVLVFFGIVPVCCTYYVEVPSVTWEELYPVFLMSIGCGLVVDTLLLVNNYRDIENDRRAGKRTLVVFIGKKATEAIFLLVVPIALAILFLVGCKWQFAVLAVLMFVKHFVVWRKMVKIGEGRELNKVLGMTAANIFLYGVLASVCVILS